MTEFKKNTREGVSENNDLVFELNLEIEGILKNIALLPLDVKATTYLREQLAQILNAFSSRECVKNIVEETSTPLLSKPYSGLSYQQLVTLMQDARLLHSGVKNPWRGGAYVWEGPGMRFKEEIFGGFGRMLDTFGYEPIQIPRQLPREVIDAVCDGVVDLEEGTYWLAELRDGELRHSNQYANSSNDAVMSYYLADKVKEGGHVLPFRGYTRHQIIRSHRDSISPRPLVNSDENFECNEAYSIQKTLEECEAEFELIIEMVGKFFIEMGISFLTVDQSNWGNKPVAKKVTSFQTFAGPVKGSVRLATIYMHDDTFSKLFGLGTVLPNGTFEPAHQVGYGLWEGLIVPLLDHLADEYGLCMPPNMTHQQVVFVPRNQDEENAAKKMISELESPMKAIIDTAYRKRFVKRLNKYRRVGVPIRVTFWSEGKLMVSRRDTLQTCEVDNEKFADLVPVLLSNISDNLRKRSEHYMNSHTEEAFTVAEIEVLSRKERKLVLFNHCAREVCGIEIEDKVKGEFLGHVREYNADGCCINCGQNGMRKALFGRRAPTP